MKKIFLVTSIFAVFSFISSTISVSDYGEQKDICVAESNLKRTKKEKTVYLMV